MIGPNIKSIKKIAITIQLYANSQRRLILIEEEPFNNMRCNYRYVTVNSDKKTINKLSIEKNESIIRGIKRKFPPFVYCHANCQRKHCFGGTATLLCSPTSAAPPLEYSLYLCINIWPTLYFHLATIICN